MADVAEIAAKVTVDGAQEAKRELDGFSDSIEQTSTRSVSAAQKMQDVGKTMTTHVTAPLLAVGGLAVKTAVDFEGAFSKIQGLVGVSADEIGTLREATLSLAGETAKAPAELADALFTITSAGLRGGEAMQVLEMAAKASAAGMGDTRTIAEALTAAMNAYGPGVLSAAEATDILVGTARAGNFETSQFAGALGQVLPIASSLGIGLEEVGGAVALLTRNNNDASASITQVRAIMQALLAPSAEATNILNQAGLTMAEVRAVASGPEGLVGALELMQSAAGGNQETLARMLGSVEAVGGAMVILNSDAAAIEGTFGAVANSAGTLDEAFTAASESSGFKMKQALADIQVALIDVGDAVLPAVTMIADGISAVASAFASLPDPVQNLVVIGGVATAAAGPVLTLAGNLGDLAGKLKGAVSEGGALSSLLGSSMTPALLGVGVAAGGALIAFQRWAEDQEKIAERAANMTEVLGTSREELEATARAFYESELQAMGASEAFSLVGLSLADMSGYVLGGTDEFGDLLERIKQTQEEGGRLKTTVAEITTEVLANRDSYNDWTVAIAEAHTEGRITTDQMRELLDALDEIADSADDSAQGLRDMALELARAAQDSDLMTEAQVRMLAGVVAATDNAGLLQLIVQELNDVLADGVPLYDQTNSGATTAAGGIEFLAGKAGIATTETQNLTSASDGLAVSFDTQYVKLETLNSAYDDLLDKTLGAVEANIRAESGWVTVTEKIDTHNAAVADGTLKGQEYTQAVDDLTLQVLSGAQAFATGAEKAAELAGETFTAADRAAIMRGKLMEAAAAAGEGSELQLAILGLIGLLDDFTGDYTAQLHVNAQAAINDLGIVIALMNQVNSTRIAPPPSLTKPGYTGGSSGGGLSTPGFGEAARNYGSYSMPGLAGGETIENYQGGIAGFSPQSFAGLESAAVEASLRAAEKASVAFADGMTAGVESRVTADVFDQLRESSRAASLDAGGEGAVEYTNRLITDLDTSASDVEAVFRRILTDPAGAEGARAADKATEMLADQLRANAGYTAAQGALLMEAFAGGMADGTSSLTAAFAEGIGELRTAGAIAADDPFWVSVGDDLASGVALGFGDAWRNEAEPALLDALEVVTMWGWDVADQGGAAAAAGGTAVAAGLVESMQRVWVGTGIPALDDMLRQLDGWGVEIDTDVAVRWWEAGGSAMQGLIDAVVTGWALSGPPSLDDIRSQLAAWGVALPVETGAYTNGYEWVSVLTEGVYAGITGELGPALGQGMQMLRSFVAESESTIDSYLSGLASTVDQASANYLNTLVDLTGAELADLIELGGANYLPGGAGYNSLPGDLQTAIDQIVRDLGPSLGITNNYNLNVTSRDATSTQAEFDRMQIMAGG